jgi:alpha-glucosidase
MPWKNETTGGFTRAKASWLPVDPRHRPLAADVQDALNGSTLAIARKLIAIRRASPALSGGSFRVVEAKGGQLLFEREGGGERLLCVFNVTTEAVTRAVDGAAPSVVWASDAVLSGKQLMMEPFGAAILKLS